MTLRTKMISKGLGLIKKTQCENKYDKPLQHQNQQQTNYNLMGNQQVKKSGILSQNIDSPHPMLNQTYVQTVQNQRLLKSQWPFYSQDQFRAWQQKYQSFIQQIQGKEKIATFKSELFSHFFLPVQFTYTRVSICSPSGIVTMYYQMVSHSLVQDLQKKAKMNQPFSEQQLWILILQLTQGLNYAHSKSIPIGDIRSENILVDSNKKRVMLSTDVSWMGQKVFKQKVVCGDQVFVSAQMSQLVQENRNSLQVEISNDDFSLGMTLAECLLLQDLSKIYQKANNKKQISRQKYENLIESLLKIKYYSLKLLLIVVGLIQIDEKSRISSKEVYEIIKPHSTVILANKEFTLTKQSLMQKCPQKYSSLQKILKQIKSKTNRQMFQNKQLITSRSITINGISTVHNVKRTFDQTFNLSFLDVSKNQVQKYFKLSAVYNQSENNERQLENFSNKYRNSEVGVPQNHIKQSSQQKAKPLITLNRIRPQADMAISQVKEVNSHVKQWNPPSLLPVTNAIYEEQKQVNTRRVLNSQPYTTNFSFHSPDSKPKVQDQEIQTSKRKTLFQARSVYESTETLLIAPSVYSVSNPPESYISYHYSKSLSKRDRPKGNNKSEIQMSLNFEDYITLKPLRFKSNDENHPKIKIQEEIQNRRRTQNFSYNQHLPEFLATRSEQKSNFM